MCIIIAKPTGVNLPAKATVRQCFAANPDGAGIAYSDGKCVTIRKGFMTFDKLWAAVKSIPHPKASAIIIHCRIATSGGIRPDVCHPYPISAKDKALRATTAHDAYAIAHNGTIHGMATDKRTSDTLAFVRDIAAPMRRLCPDLIHNDDALSILETCAGSKLVLINGAGDLVTLGAFVEDGGVFYSNTSYKPWTYGINRRGDSSYTAWWQDETAPLWDDKLAPMFDCCEACEMYDECDVYGYACADKTEAEMTAKKYPYKV